MLAFIIRLDDATPKMNHKGWSRIEEILDKNNIKPIVGVIPESKDLLFTWEEDPEFWEKTVARWQNKGWTIAQHGCYHVYRDCGNGIRSEFTGLSYDEQIELIEHGYLELKKHNVNPTCFFAPAHTFDDTTVDVIRDCGHFDFISDGHAIYPYKENNMLFFPSIFDTAHKLLPFGVYTFVLHPSFTTDREFEHLEEFIKKNKEFFLPVNEILEQCNKNRKRNVIEKLIKPTITVIRKMRKFIKK